MAYIPIPDTEIAPESPVTSVLIHKLRDNPLAIADGLPGAPRMQVAAIGITAGDVLTSYPEDEIEVSWGTWTKTGPGVVCGGITGTIRIKFSMTLAVLPGFMFGQLWFNNVAISPEYLKNVLGKEYFELDYTLTGPGLIELRTLLTQAPGSSAGELAIYSAGTIQFTRENV